MLEDGRSFTVPGEPSYVIDYLSTWVDAEPDETYEVDIALAGLSAVEGFFEVWNFDIGEVRNYRFDKTVKVTHIETGEVFSGEEFEEALRSQIVPTGTNSTS